MTDERSERWIRWLAVTGRRSEEIAEQRRLARDDMRLFGNTFWTEDSNGNVRRIDPCTVRLERGSVRVEPS